MPPPPPCRTAHTWPWHPGCARHHRCDHPGCCGRHCAPMQVLAPFGAAHSVQVPHEDDAALPPHELKRLAGEAGASPAALAPAAASKGKQGASPGLTGTWPLHLLAVPCPPPPPHTHTHLGGNPLPRRRVPHALLLSTAVQVLYSCWRQQEPCLAARPWCVAAGCMLHCLAPVRLGLTCNLGQEEAACTPAPPGLSPYVCCAPLQPAPALPPPCPATC